MSRAPARARSPDRQATNPDRRLTQHHDRTDAKVVLHQRQIAEENLRLLAARRPVARRINTNDGDACNRASSDPKSVSALMYTKSGSYRVETVTRPVLRYDSLGACEHGVGGPIGARRDRA
jgi:hypothetical protein